MTRAQYFVNFVGDAAVTMSDISKMFMGLFCLLGLLGSNGFQSNV